MSEDSSAIPTRLSASEFLAVLERWEVLPAAKLRELQARFDAEIEQHDSESIARTLVQEGTLTEFQARRLLVAKKGLAFGRYVLLDLIGRGGRGRVFKARHRLMDRVVALKVVLPDCVLDTNAVARFFREMRIVGRLDHPNVVRALDADEYEGSPYIVMEHLQGENLAEVSRRQPILPWTEVTGYMAQAAWGLAHAHERGVIHRDIKPTNLFLIENGVVKVLDLGFGELVGPSDREHDVFDTDLGKVVGTMDYVSPEQVTDQPIDARTDLFSLGCTMYRLLTDAYAFPGLTKEHRLVKRIREKHVPIRDVRPDLPYGLAAIVDRLIALRPDDRYGSAAEVAEALEGMIRPVVSTDRGARTKAGGGKSPSVVSPAPPEPEAPPVDWSRIESALPAPGAATRETPTLRDDSEARRSSSKDLASHRKTLEDEGIESGKDIQKKYRTELIQMKRAMEELRATEPKADEPDEDAGWLEHLGERIGDILAEPSAGQVLIAILTVVLVLALALVYAMG